MTTLGAVEHNQQNLHVFLLQQLTKITFRHFPLKVIINTGVQLYIYAYPIGCFWKRPAAGGEPAETVSLPGPSQPSGGENDRKEDRLHLQGEVLPATGTVPTVPTVPPSQV